ncbi:hypothetical protein [Xenorhabdus bovienii]|uniref:hypothetical protein n=1 Tax=Xenorhabdus bovienii TaxID=40576 RepID=UPI00237CBEC8|nr:hypothetical protein [Xenorhabdus bovienii]MDE1474931.1 hypothetical protein [Xenorhabdus bovienii]MDE1482203.1 hypothetical protein [Xenorhabdus bovienii]MDE9428936.1 hypothetical protein [Xenorhabdus bovienii]MDE9432890.1 hypothetical protein [Xenorhabdus bovienii]MDE9442300.1 hypothetical protein [Xenorhabdus bovienii]
MFIIALLAGCNKRDPLKKWEQYGTQPFNAKQWQQKHERLSMVWDLLKTASICNLSASELENMLSKPDGYFLTEKNLAWVMTSELQFVADIPFDGNKPENFFVAGDLKIKTSFSCSKSIY